MEPLPLDELLAQLQAFCRAQVGDGAAQVDELQALGGQPVRGYAFRLSYRQHDEQRPEALVLRLSPADPRPGAATVLREALLLQRLAGSRVPAPRLRWAGDEPAWFGRSYLVTERPYGQVLHLIGDGALPSLLSEDVLYAMAGQALEALAELHRLAWQMSLPNWGPPIHPADDVRQWDARIGCVAEASLRDALQRLRGRLLATLPESAPTGLRHGAFCWAKLLFDRGALSAVIDWQHAGIGSVLNDLGYFVLFSDRESWSPEVRWHLPLPPPEWLTARYARAAGRPELDCAWYRALAGYACALVIAGGIGPQPGGPTGGQNLATSVPYLLARAAAVLDAV